MNFFEWLGVLLAIISLVDINNLPRWVSFTMMILGAILATWMGEVERDNRETGKDTVFQNRVSKSRPDVNRRNRK